MKMMIINDKKVNMYGSLDCDIWVIQPTDECRMDTIELEYSCLDENICLIAVGIKNWNIELSPWSAQAVFETDDFGNGATDTLRFIKDILLAALYENQKRKPMKVILAGYSLAGLFALWAGYECDIFDGIVAASPSVWFPNWKEYIDTHIIQADSVYLSLGDKETKTKNKTLAQVGNAIEYQYTNLKKQGLDTYFEWNIGNHFADVSERVAKGICWIKNRR